MFVKKRNGVAAGRAAASALALILSLSMLMMSSGRARARAGQTPVPARRAVTLAYEPAPEHGLPLLRAQVSNGAQHQAGATFLLDTGFTPCLMTDRLAGLLRLAGELALRDDGTAACFADGRPLKQVTAGLQIGDFPAGLRDFTLLKAYRLDLLDCPLDGVLGWRFLSEYAVLFDFQTHRVTLWHGGVLSAEELRTAGMDGATVAPQVNRAAGSFDIAVRLNDRLDVLLAVDTGGAHTLIDIADARLLGLQPARLGFRQSTVFGDLKANEAPLASLAFAGLRVSDLPVRYLLTPHPNLPPHLGLDVLARYRLLLDYPARKCYLKPIQTP